MAFGALRKGEIRFARGERFNNKCQLNGVKH